MNVHTGNSSEVDMLLQEKKYFLARLNEDNDKMVQLLEVHIYLYLSFSARMLIT